MTTDTQQDGELVTVTLTIDAANWLRAELQHVTKNREAIPDPSAFVRSGMSFARAILAQLDAAQAGDR